jgi:cell division protein FtsA
VVLTGGGALLRGASELAQSVLGLPVKIGIPSGFGMAALAPEVESPIYATAVGLVIDAFRRLDAPAAGSEEQQQESSGTLSEAHESEHEKRSIVARMKKFFEEF